MDQINLLKTFKDLVEELESVRAKSREDWIRVEESEGREAADYYRGQTNALDYVLELLRG